MTPTKSVPNRTLFWKALSVIAIIALGASITVQVALPRTGYTAITERLTYTQTIVQQATESATSVQFAGPYILVWYAAKTTTSIGSLTPASGNTFLIVTMTIENHGYGADTPTTDWHHDFYIVINGAQYIPSAATSSLVDILPVTEVGDGLAVVGSIAFEVPVNFVEFSLVYSPPSPDLIYNIQYVRQ